MWSPTETDRRYRFVTLCQQLLALAVVVAVLTPAARTVTMDVRPAPTPGVVPGGMSLRAASIPVKVPTGPVHVEHDEYALTAPKGAGRTRADLRASARAAHGGSAITSEALPVHGYGTVGVTWSSADEVDDEQIGIRVRTRKDGAWSGWTVAEYHDEHAPDPGTPEARTARPGTDAVLIGDVDAVQVRVDTEKAAPSDMRLAVIDPGTPSSTAKQLPRIDTARMAATATTDGTSGAVDPAIEEPTDGDATDDLSMQAGVYTPKPQIYSRAQWGANESLRDKSSLSYYEVHAGFVHHTVNANDYTGPQVPGIIRGIYSYHTQSRGWSDIGYNFLVDKFGRIWEGRYGGVSRPVVGAHTLGYNEYSFAMSAIGNFETTQPRDAMIDAYGVLMAWKLSLHGVAAGDTSQVIKGKRFYAINGHRDAGSTACPGRYLYAKIGTIRSKAVAAQRSFSGRNLESNMVGVRQPDLVVRRKSDGRGIVVPMRELDGRFLFSSPIDTGQSFAGVTRIWKAGDWNRDGFVDVMAVRRSDTALVLYRGLGRGKLGDPVVIRSSTRGLGLMAPAGDVTGDGWPDFMAQPSGGSMRIYPGIGLSGLGSSYAAYRPLDGGVHIPVGRWNSTDGAPDSIVRKASSLTIYYGNGPGGWTSARSLSTSAAGYDWFLGVSSVDYRTDSHTDVIARKSATGEVYFIRGTAAGFKTPVKIGTQGGYDLAG